MGILDLVFPKKCLGCSREGKYLCNTCLSKVRKVKMVCPYCEKASIDGMTHAKCLRVYGLDGLVSIFDYEGVVRRAILALKYKYATEIAKELTYLIVYSLKDKKAIFAKNGILIPIPLHWYRNNFRGFNQAELIGRGLSKLMNWQFAPEVLVRRRSTAPQSLLKKESRFSNLSGAFSLGKPNPITNRSFVLFDDVFTTGSTLKEAAAVLKRKGARSVWGLSIAR